ncbi:hypothetical protein DRE_02794 [Drechslerella stenobrocha 248]|uniref:OTU domain-containing protein n=1 Tax=Drechslerella stenobrocha 248 TaxID=1043628 RepID=W7I606_9PEZI|nr:hypothetical protein DRE_02794 [Drechslerella stenobrocha 248]
MSDEFPLLEGLGLYASDIIGDGECLFRSFSDQLYGNQAKAHEIRQRTTSYMREHADFFKLFLSVPPTRRKKSANAATPSQDAVDRAFTDHVNRMERSGVYGDNLEIVAFARCYAVNVKIYQREFAYQISCDDGDGQSTGTTTTTPQLLHIAYHSWEHYSSVRNSDGPHTGLPNVSPKALTEAAKKQQKDALERTVEILPWMEKVVAASLPNAISVERVREMLVKCKGDVNMAVSRLLDAEEEEEEKEEEEKKEREEEEREKEAGEPSEAVAEVARKGKSKDKADRKAGRAAAKPIGDGKVGPEQAKPRARPKKETARERKDRMQREKMERKKAKAGPTAGGGGTAVDHSTDALAEDIKTLHV